MDYGLLGRNIRSLRIRKNLTIRQLALAAEVDKSTIVRLEKGMPVKPEIGNRIAHALNTDLRRVMLPSNALTENMAIHREETGKWLPTQDRRPARAAELGDEGFEDEKERLRLMRHGFVPGFGRLFNCALPEGNLVAGVLELFEAQPYASVSTGEVFFVVQRGAVRLMVDGIEYTLLEGDAVTFVNLGVCGLEPLNPLGPEDLPPVILYVRQIRAVVRAIGQGP